MRKRGHRLAVTIMAAMLLLPLGASAPARAEELLAAPVLHDPQPTGVSGYSVNLSWERVLDAVSYRVRVRFDGYDTDYFDQRTVNDQILLWATAGPGTFIWTVTAISAGGVEGTPAAASYNFRPMAPKLLSPPEGAVLNMPDDGIEFRWTGGIRSGVHWDQQADGTPWTWPSGGASGIGGKAWGWLPVGVSRWFVSTLGLYDNAPRSASSEIRHVTVTWDDATPQVDPERSEKVASAGETVRLAWRPVPGAAAYLLQFVGADESFPGLESSELEFGTFRDVPVPWAGSRKWRVAAIPSGAELYPPSARVIGPWSDAQTVAVANPCAGTQIVSPADGAVLDSFPLLRWASDGCSVSVEMSIDQAPIHVQQYNAQVSAMAVPAPLFGMPETGDVTIRWRVTAGDDPAWRSFTVHRDDAPAITQPQQVTLLGPADCPDPAACSPINGLPVLRWAPVPGAGAYRVVVVDVDGGGYRSAFTVGTEAPAPLPYQGTSTWHKWAVIACPSAAVCDGALPADAWTFGTTLPAPTLLGSPSVVEPGPDVAVAWARGELPSDPNVLSVGWRSDLAVEVVSAPQGGTIVALSEGVGRDRAWIGNIMDQTAFRWRARSVGAGVVGAWSDWHEVVVQAPPVTLLTPADGATVDSSPVLRWEPVSDTTTGYRVHVTRDEDANRPGWAAADFGGWVNGATSVPWPALPPGHYTWTVARASPHNRGTPTSTGHFTVVGDGGITLLSPGPGDTVTSNGAVFAWAPAAGAGSYWIRVATDPSMADEKTVAEGWTDATQYAVSTELPDGPLYWMVCASLPEVGSAACSPITPTGAAPETMLTAQKRQLALATAGVASGDSSTSPIGVSEVRQVIVQGREVAADTIPPAISTPGIAIASGVSMGTGGDVALDVSWTASDRGLGIASQAVMVTDSAGRTTSHAVHVGARQLRVRLKAGSFKIAVVVGDLAGNVASKSLTRTLVVVDDRSSSWRWSWSWRRVLSTPAYRGSLHASAVRGATARLTASARSVAVIVGVRPGRGSLVALTAGASSKTIVEKRATAVNRLVVRLWSWTATASRTITLRLPSGGRTTVVDGIVILR